MITELPPVTLNHLKKYSSVNSNDHANLLKTIQCHINKIQQFAQLSDIVGVGLSYKHMIYTTDKNVTIRIFHITEEDGFLYCNILGAILAFLPNVKILSITEPQMPAMFYNLGSVEKIIMNFEVIRRSRKFCLGIIPKEHRHQIKDIVILNRGHLKFYGTKCIKTLGTCKKKFSGLESKCKLIY